MMYFLIMVKVLQEFFGILKILQVQNSSTRHQEIIGLAEGLQAEEPVAAAVETLVPDLVHTMAAGKEVAAFQHIGQMDAGSGRRVEPQSLADIVPGHLVQHQHHIGTAEHHIEEAELHTVEIGNHRPVDLRREVDIVVELLAKETGV